MATSTSIEWTDVTWNPYRGCDKISPGCARCYAETFAERFRGVAGHPYEQGFDLLRVGDKFAEPFRLTRPRRVFVNSMSDLFHDDVPEADVVAIARVMARADWHTYQVLTKRSGRMRRMLEGPLRFASSLPHIFWGVSVEDRKYGLPRVDDLRQSPAGLRMLSVEPLLEDLGPGLDLSGIGWVILGGESGRNPRPLEEAWALRVRDLCARSGVPFFFKQWGGSRKGKAGRILQGRTHDEVPALSERPMPGLAERRGLVEAFEATGRVGPTGWETPQRP